MKFVKPKGSCETTGRAQYNTQYECEQAMKNMKVNPDYVAWHCPDCGYWHFGKPRNVVQVEPKANVNDFYDDMQELFKDPVEEAKELLESKGYKVIKKDAYDTLLENQDKYIEIVKIVGGEN